jgi:hypothetical protein
LFFIAHPNKASVSVGVLDLSRERSIRNIAGISPTTSFVLSDFELSRAS